MIQHIADLLTIVGVFIIGAALAAAWRIGGPQ